MFKKWARINKKNDGWVELLIKSIQKRLLNSENLGVPNALCVALYPEAFLNFILRNLPSYIGLMLEP